MHSKERLLAFMLDISRICPHISGKITDGQGIIQVLNKEKLYE